MNGDGVFVHSDGARYSGGWKDNWKSGEGAETYMDGGRYEGEFE